jgi:hypothetical protein
MFPESKEEFEKSIRRANRRPINRYLVLRALKAIEGIVSEDVAMPLQEKVDLIYELAHAALNKCNNNHDDWKQKIIATHKTMIAMGVSIK